MASEIEDAAKEFAKSLIIDTLKEWYSYIKNYNNNMNELQDKYNLLAAYKDTFSNKVEQRKQENLHKSTILIDIWLAKVRNLVEKDEVLQQLVDEKIRKDKDHCCYGRINCNLYQRYEMSKLAKIKVDEIESVIKERPHDSMTTEPRLDLKSIPNEFLTSLRSRVVLMEEILNKLRDDQVNVVGIFGMGAIGKTMLVKEIANKGAKDMFEKTVMVEISESPNVERIQDEIAEQLNLKLDNLHSIEQRAKFVYNTLIGNTKILIILDNLWGKLDLGKVGIPKPYDNSQQFSCKLLVTSRMKNVCEVMGVSMANIFEVCPLDINEARQLFRTRVGANARHDGLKEQEEVEKRMLNKCGGLPLAIVALADVLKNQELSTWEHFASELEKPISNSQAKISGVHRQTYSILETSYKLMESEEKKRFFLLACLFPFGTSIPVEEMMRYGIGLGLFQRVNNLTEATELANTWVDELKSSALLLEDDSQGYYTKIHDVVRESTISFAEKDGNMFMVEAFPRWLLLETCQKYNAISLMSGADHSRLNELNSNKLQILRLDRSEPRDHFPDSFFQGMSNLKVLVLKEMDFSLRLANSIRKLSRLRTLHLEECKLGDISRICELVDLVVLSLRKSTVEELPVAIGINLCNLRLLDLNHCIIKRRKGIPANVLSKLSKLEGFYAYRYGQRPWKYDNEKRSDRYAFARIAELNNLRYLKVVELLVEFNEWPIRDDQLQFVKNLDHFHISFGWTWLASKTYSRVLEFIGVDNVSSIAKYKSLGVLLEKTQLLLVENLWKLQYIFDDYFQQQEEEAKTHSFLLGICNIIHVPELPHLQHLEVIVCPKMHSISSTLFKAPNLTYLWVSYCENMKFLFQERVHHQLNVDGDPNEIVFPCLKRMTLIHIPKLESVTGIIITKNDQEVGNHILFNQKVIFPSLEELKITNLYKIVQLWEFNCKANYYSSFQNLRNLNIDFCCKLKTLGCFSIANALVQLKQLSIRCCPLLREVIGLGEEETEVPKFGEEIFPSLEGVRLEDCPKLKIFISGGYLKLSSLQQLNINNCPKMQSFSSGLLFEAPKLNQIEFNHVHYSITDKAKDINSFLQNFDKPK